MKLITFKVKNEWSYTSTPPIRLHGLDRENFTFYILSIEWLDGGKYRAKKSEKSRGKSDGISSKGFLSMTLVQLTKRCNNV